MDPIWSMCESYTNTDHYRSVEASVGARRELSDNIGLHQVSHLNLDLARQDPTGLNGSLRNLMLVYDWHMDLHEIPHAPGGPVGPQRLSGGPTRLVIIFMRRPQFVGPATPTGAGEVLCNSVSKSLRCSFSLCMLKFLMLHAAAQAPKANTIIRQHNESPRTLRSRMRFGAQGEPFLSSMAFGGILPVFF